MKIFSTIVYWFLIVIALIQFIPVNRTNKPVDSKANFVNIYSTPRNVQQILKKACYDCHSNETVYPDYAYVAPTSWSIKNHVNNMSVLDKGSLNTLKQHSLDFIRFNL